MKAFGIKRSRQRPAVTHAKMSAASDQKGHLKAPGPQHVSTVAVSRRILPIAAFFLHLCEDRTISTQKMTYMRHYMQGVCDQCVGSCVANLSFAYLNSRTMGR